MKVTTLCRDRAFLADQGLAGVEYKIQEYKYDSGNSSMRGTLVVRSCTGKEMRVDLDWHSDGDETEDFDLASEEDSLVTIQRHIAAFMANWSYELANRGAKDRFHCQATPLSDGVRDIKHSSRYSPFDQGMVKEEGEEFNAS